MSERSFTSSRVTPVIWPLSVIRDWIVGAEVTRLSRMIASRRPMFVSVTVPNFRAPSPLSVKLTAGRLF